MEQALQRLLLGRTIRVSPTWFLGLPAGFPLWPFFQGGRSPSVFGALFAIFGYGVLLGPGGAFRWFLSVLLFSAGHYVIAYILRLFPALLFPAFYYYVAVCRIKLYGKASAAELVRRYQGAS